MRFAPEAIVHWRLRPTLTGTWRQYFGYARGDAHAGMYTERHALRFAVYGGFGAVLASRRRWPIPLIAVGVVAYARRPVTRAWRLMGDPMERLAASVVVPALIGWIDTAKMAGYATGLVDRAKGR